MKQTIYAYKNVFNRADAKEFTFLEFINNPKDMLVYFGLTNDVFEKIKNISDKQERNDFKRNNLPAVDISNASILSVDIDNISTNNIVKQNVIDLLKKDKARRVVYGSK